MFHYWAYYSNNTDTIVFFWEQQDAVAVVAVDDAVVVADDAVVVVVAPSPCSLHLAQAPTPPHSPLPYFHPLLRSHLDVPRRTLYHWNKDCTNPSRQPYCPIFVLRKVIPSEHVYDWVRIVVVVPLVPVILDMVVVT